MSVKSNKTLQIEWYW